MGNRIARSCLAGILAAWGCVAFAQDPVAAKDEPSHHNKLENAVVRVLDVEVPAGGATQYHTHSTDYPYVMVSEALLRNEIPGKDPADIKIPAGLIGFYRASQGAYTHRFVNVGNGTFRAIGVELLGPRLSASVTDPLPASSGFKTELDNERVRVYRAVLAPGQSIGPVALGGPGVRVVMNDGVLEQSVAGGQPERVQTSVAQFVWREKPVVGSLRNAGERPLEIIEIEIK